MELDSVFVVFGIYGRLYTYFLGGEGGGGRERDSAYVIDCAWVQVWECLHLTTPSRKVRARVIYLKLALPSVSSSLMIVAQV